ncbi:hypothetical protein PRUPE_4G220200 [Prunus persica]|uniref:DUF4408 domain-containing protein n=1 Tax=Prunus persica TaxID=3760 RepID=M5WZA2_PRUPE|nr:hypothetical protein PRUPE_4G220200 [Prunus persica]
MNTFEKSQILLLSLLAILLTIAPLLSSSLRTPYLYIITNLVIVALGAQAGLLSASSKPSDHDKKEGTISAAHKPVIAPELAYSSDKWFLAHNDEDQRVASKCAQEKPKVVELEKSLSEKIVGSVKMESVKKCPSMPSLFFIGDGEADQGDLDEVTDYNHEVEEEEEIVELSGPELFAKAETLIGNFYKQLKMQREESWKKIHGSYQKAF